MSLILDDCCHCACMTELQGYTRETAVIALEDGSLKCGGCEDFGEDDDGHFSCVALYDGEELVADRRCQK